MCHSKWKQNYSNSVTFVAKKAKETLIIGLTFSHSYWNKNIWKSPLNPRALACFENLSKCPSSCPSLFLVANSLRRHVDFLWYLSAKKEHLLGIPWLSVEMARGRMDECNELKHMKDIYRLIYWIEMLQLWICFSKNIFQYNSRAQIV